ncbi:zygote arrest protein 1-like [Babylonia areolata]|uniref:zygote arrest protein 1-like n=1 Tax=Babylonia areolata TaxID=304850 RepID=UPI003FD5C247
MDRRYGFFRCTNCRKTWESSHVYCAKGTDEPVYKQDCKSCHTACVPYRVEKIRCAVCGLEECVCTKEEKAERHVDPNKPHLKDLCHKCRSGDFCTKSDYY